MIEIAEFDMVEVQTDVTVQILTNTKTGETSIGWTRNLDMIEDMIRHAHYVNPERGDQP